jgi:hAT family C-terminal dimerisation region
MKVAQPADAVMTMAYDDCAIDYFLETYGGIIHRITSALAKAEMNSIKSSIDVRKRFNPSLSSAAAADAQRYCIPFPATAAEVAELKNFTNFFKVLHYVITLPVSSATCERSFSAMRRVRNYLRSTMTEDRLTSLSLLHIEGKLSSRIDAHDVVAHYAETGNRRQQFY